MIGIRIKNANHGELKDIQDIVNQYGFGVLFDDQGDLIAGHPGPLHGKDMADVDQDLTDNVGKHIAVSFF